MFIQILYSIFLSVISNSIKNSYWDSNKSFLGKTQYLARFNIGRLSATVTDVLQLSAGDEITLREFFDSGGLREIDGGEESTYITVYKIDD